MVGDVWHTNFIQSNSKGPVTGRSNATVRSSVAAGRNNAAVRSSSDATVRSSDAAVCSNTTKLH